MLKDLLLLLKAMAATTSKPSVHLGNMTFAWSQASTFVNDAVAKRMMDAFVGGGGVFFDSARIYAGGKSEEMTGIMLVQELHLGNRKLSL